MSHHPLLVLSAIACLVAAVTNNEGLAYLASNAAKDGVTTTASGLQYAVLNQAGHTDGPRPTLYTPTMFSVAGRTIDGMEFLKATPPGQSEPMRPADMKAGMQEALMLMRPGDVFEFTMPGELGIGGSARGEIVAGSVLIYEIALERVAAEPTTAAWLADMILHRYPMPFLLSAYLLFRAAGWLFGLDTVAAGPMYRAEMHKNHEQNQRVFFDVEIGGEPKGRIVFELFNHFVPITCDNFRTLCAGSAKNKSWTYKGCAFHRIIENFMVQGGDFTAGNGTGGRSVYETPKFADEFGPGYITHSKHVLSMANSGKDTNGSQFFITARECVHLDGRHVVFGMVVEGHDVVNAMEAVAGTPPTSEVRIANCGEIKTKST